MVAKILLLTIAIALGSTETQLPDENRLNRIVQGTERVVESATQDDERTAPSLDDIAPATRARIENIVRQTELAAESKISVDAPPAEDDKPQGIHYKLLVSTSMPTAELKSALAMARGRNDLTIVFRGIKEGMSLGDFIRFLHELTGLASFDHAQLDPTVFSELGVQRVPVLIRYRGQELISHVGGIINVDWLERRADSGDTGDLGQQGPMAAVSEPNLIDLMKAKAASIDGEKAKASARERFWQTYSFIELPVATNDDVWQLDPSFIVTEDIEAEDGTLIAKAGDIVNPLQVVPFHQRLVVFNAMDPLQVEATKAILSENTSAAHVLMTTHVSVDNGWGDLNDLHASLGQPVYLLTAPVQERFEVKRVPTVITANESHFQMHERAIAQ